MQALEGLYRGLDAIWNTEFPKTCTKCGRVYHSIQDYFDTTVAPAEGTGLMGVELDEVQQAQQPVGLFRNCSCGSTLVAFCRDRRDMSESGIRRREFFGQLLDNLIEAGIPRESARSQLLHALKTGKLGQLEAALRDANAEKL